MKRILLALVLAVPGFGQCGRILAKGRVSAVCAKKPEFRAAQPPFPPCPHSWLEDRSRFRSYEEWMAAVDAWEKWHNWLSSMRSERYFRVAY